MDEITMRVARALASLPRLQILSLLAQHRKLAPTALASKLAMPLPTMSAHLRVLISAGLVRRQKSGSWCYYLAESPYSEAALSGMVTRWLVDLLNAPRKAMSSLGLSKVRDTRRAGDCAAELYELVYEAATAFTDLRRLQILRRLAAQGPATAAQLREELSMSKQAVSRHVTKLIRRGYVTSSPAAGGTQTYALATEAKTPVHAELLKIVQTTWREE